MILKVHAKVNFAIRKIKCLLKSSKQINIKVFSNKSTLTMACSVYPLANQQDYVNTEHGSFVFSLRIANDSLHRLK